jgi:hypothetical protein
MAVWLPVHAATARPGSAARSGRPPPAVRRAGRPGRPGLAGGPRTGPGCGRGRSGAGGGPAQLLALDPDRGPRAQHQRDQGRRQAQPVQHHGGHAEHRYSCAGRPAQPEGLSKGASVSRRRYGNVTARSPDPPLPLAQWCLAGRPGEPPPRFCRGGALRQPVELAGDRALGGSGGSSVGSCPWRRGGWWRPRAGP